MQSTLSRWNRRALLGAAGASVASRAFAQSDTLAGACVLSTTAAEGPFYFDSHLVRSDITEGRAGVPLALTLQILDVRGCAPVRDARVDVWQAGPDGLYSGYDHQFRGARSTIGKTFLRGTQMSDANGQATFKTTYPGWYWGRTVHIHYKVWTGTKEMLTSQIYFPDDLNDRIFATRAPYNARKEKRDVTNATEFNIMLKPVAGAFADVMPQGAGYAASLVIGLDRERA